MGACASKPSPRSDVSPSISNREEQNDQSRENAEPVVAPTLNGHGHGHNKKEAEKGNRSPFFPFYSPSPIHHSFWKKSPANVTANSTPMRLFKRSFAPPSPAKHIKELLARRHASVKPNEGTIIPDGLDKNFGFSKNFGAKFELGKEVGRGHFGYTCVATGKKGELKGKQVAVKIIPKSKVRFLIVVILVA